MNNGSITELRKTFEEARANKVAELEKIEQMKAEAAEALRLANIALDEATVNTDPEAYEKAKADRAKAETAIEMYNRRLKQLNIDHSYITEEVSNSFIDKVLQAEEKSTAAYLEAIKEPLEKLQSITANYKRDISEAENLVNAWCNEIHPNYRTFGRETRVIDGVRTDRSTKPVQIHPFGYKYSPETLKVEQFIKDMRA